MISVFCIFGEGGQGSLKISPEKSNETPIWIWVHGLQRVLYFFLNFAYGIVFFAFLEGGSLRYLAHFPRTVRKNPIWIGYMDFTGFWIFFFSEFCLWNCFFCILGRGRPRGLRKFPSKSPKQIQSGLGTWISSGFGVFVGILFMRLFFCVLGRGGPGT